MNLLIVTNEYFNFFNFRQSIIKKLKKNFKPTKLSLLAKFDGYEDKININDIDKFNINFNSRSLNIFNAIKNIWDFYKILNSNNYDTIISYTFLSNFNSCFLNIFLKKKLIVNITGMGDMFLSKNLLKRVLFWIYIKILVNSSIIICQNVEDKKYFILKNNKLKKKIKVILGSGVDTKNFKYTKIQSSKKFKFLLVSRIIKEKGVLEFIEAANKFEKFYPNLANFIIIGRTYNGSFKKTFFEKIYQSKITYKENSKNIKNDIIKSSCCVLPSYREGLSRFLLEAISIGRPIITSNVPGCNILVKDNYNGFLLPNISSESLFKMFIKFSILNKKKINTFSYNSRKLSIKFDSEIIDNQLIKILKTL